MKIRDLQIKQTGLISLFLILSLVLVPHVSKGGNLTEPNPNRDIRLTNTEPPTLNSCTSPWPLRRWMLMYGGELVGKRTEEELQAIAQRFEFSIGDKAKTVADLLGRHKAIYRGTFRYNSLTDNYVTGINHLFTIEHDWLMANVTKYGVTNDAAYMHYWNDTELILEGVSVVIKGWGGGSASFIEEARIPVYYSNLSRRLANFSTREARALYRDYNIQEIINKPVFDNVYPLGIMFDNSTPKLYNFGKVVSGGQVLEHPNHAVIGSTEYNTWHWIWNIGLFLNELNSYIKDNPSLVGGRSVSLIPNVSGIPGISSGTAWEDTYTNFFTKPGIDLLLEYQYSPTRNTGLNWVISAFSKEQAAHNVGISTLHSALPIKTIKGYVGSFTLEEATMNNLAMHWVIRSENKMTDSRSYFLGAQFTVPLDWDNWSVNLLAAHDVDLGKPIGDPFILASGKDGKGYPYKVYAREFVCGLAAVRVRGKYDQDFDESTTVSIPLQGSYLPVQVTGATEISVTKWNFRNGAGQIFLKP